MKKIIQPTVVFQHVEPPDLHTTIALEQEQ